MATIQFLWCHCGGFIWRGGTVGRSDLLLEENYRKIGGKIQQKDTRRKGEEKKEIKSVN